MVGAGPWSLILSGILGSLITLAMLDRVSDRRPQLCLDLEAGTALRRLP